MKKLPSFLLNASLLCCVALFSCDQNMFTGCANEDAFDSNNNLYFNILDSRTQENIWTQIYLYHQNYRDTIKIYREDHTIAYRTSSDFIGQFNFIFIERNKDRDVTNQRIERRFYLYLNHLDTDTIDIAFELKKDRCHNHIIKNFKVAYNDSIYFDESTSNVPNITFMK